MFATMSKLTERQMEIIRLYYYKGMNQHEIVDELGIRQQSVVWIMKLAVNRIRKFFEEIFKKVSVKWLKTVCFMRGLISLLHK